MDAQTPAVTEGALSDFKVPRPVRVLLSFAQLGPGALGLFILIFFFFFPSLQPFSS